METYFEINGVQIPFDSIKEYRKVVREYIYRPIFIESSNGVFRGKRYVLKEMDPYAAILDESERKTALFSHKSDSFVESLGKDIATYAGGIMDSITDKFNIKALKYNKYLCINQAGRVFATYLEDIPAVMIRGDGKESLVYKNDGLYSTLGDAIAPTIKNIPALVINTVKEVHTFYGNGIQIDVDKEYERLKSEIKQFNEERNAKKPKYLAPKITINIPGLKKKKSPLQIESPKNDIELLSEINPGIIEYDPLDINKDGVVDEKDFLLYQELKDKGENH